MRIVILDCYSINPGDLPWDVLEQQGEVICYDRTDENDHPEIIKRIGDADIVITIRTPLSAEILKSCTNLKMVLTVDTGKVCVDPTVAIKFGVTTFTVEGTGAYSSAQTAMALLLEICHRIQNHSDSVMRGDWEHCEDFCYWLSTPIELSGKQLGIAGYSAAAAIFADMAKALGMIVSFYDRYSSTDGYAFVDLDVLIRQSEILLLCSPPAGETKQLIRAENIRKMKDGVIIISNLSDDFIKEADLADALADGKVAAAALDTVSTNPIEKDNPLLKAKNCIITPRLSWATKENRGRILEDLSVKIAAFLSETKEIPTEGKLN
ncbi:MAG: D-2-hydroxyacid dehydrogenase [Oscillospiraceae bacterium]|nr:D-2-hydroxyacid dehydrogenase [Oscillospiraceae bacterium]